eukprot:TRINITY_DN3005_c0_g1_i6.p1 TRINITY_DN3005_c0_g1~~TRINITY_DN3005_c0_g1_i6.p1  ORF type:complete len:132 (-),score=22.63 TRINITY_DN3005_c0_g1_i6:354-701(-)
MSGSWRFLFRVLFRQRKKLVFPVRNGILFGFIFLAGVVVSKKSLMYRQKFFEREGLTETEEIKKRVVLNGDGETFPLSGQFAQIHYTCWVWSPLFYTLTFSYWMVPNLTQRDLIR